MKRRTKGLALAAAALLVVALAPGCFKVKEEVTVMPDGSGRLEVRLGFNKKLIEDTMKQMMGGHAGAGRETTQDPTKIDLSDLQKNYEGFVAFSKPVHEDGEEGWKYVSFKAYFDDANKVRIYGKEKGVRTLETKFSFAKSGDGWVFTVENAGKDQAETAKVDQVPPQQSGMIKMMMATLLKDFSFDESLTVPGTVTSIEGLTSKAGRTGTFHLDVKDMQNPSDLKKISSARVLKVTCGPSQVSPEEMGAFEKELAKAKAEWAEIKAEGAKQKTGPEKAGEGGEKSGEGDDEGHEGGEKKTK